MDNKQIKELKQAYFRCFDTDDGKKVLSDLLGFCGQDASSVRSVPIDPNQVCFNEGKRRVYLRLMKFTERKDD